MCSHAGCQRPASAKAARGLCNAHYHRARRGLPLDGEIQDRGDGWTSTHGYRYLGHRAEHRLIVEQLLGRKLTYNEVVHHKDGNPQNNDPSNLEVMDRGAHAREHTLGKTNEQRVEEKAQHGWCRTGGLAGNP